MIDLATAIPKLDDVDMRFERISAEMGNPETYQDIDRMRQLSKDRAEIEETVQTYRDYRRTVQGLADNEVLLRDDDLRDLAHEEIARLSARKEALEKHLLKLLVPVDPLDKKDVFLEIRAGTGGEEAALFAGALFRMYGRYAEKRGWKVEILSISETELGGLREVVAQIEGARVYSFLKYESGTHRVQRVPATEAQGRIHTSAVTVAVMPEADDVDIQINESDLRVDVYRASGAGGQHVNKTESAVRLTHIPTGVVVTCQDERSQMKNRAKAMNVLKARLFEAARETLEREQRDTRRAMVGSGDRSERIRTYNFPQNRLTDHRIGLTLYKLELVMEGDLDEVISGLQAYFSAQALST